jgi:hypothetical protein
MRTRAERRKNTWKIIRNRVQLEKDTNLEGHELQYDEPHKYNKSKLYSVGRGRKTNNKGEHRYAPKNYSPNKNWSATDQRKLDELAQQEEELSDAS